MIALLILEMGIILVAVIDLFINRSYELLLIYLLFFIIMLGKALSFF